MKWEWSEGLTRVLRRICLVVFLLLCLMHFFSQRELWLDENFILENIQKFDYGELLGVPLENSQAFPRIYLILIKSFSQPFHYHVLALRFFPLIVMLLAFYVWERIYRKVFARDESYLLALLTLSCSYYMSYYSAEFKPYSMDVLVTGVAGLSMLKQATWRSCGTLSQVPKIEIWSQVFLPCALLFSYAGIFVFWIIGLNFILLARRHAFVWPPAIVYGLVSASFVALVYHIDLRHSLHHRALLEYWDSYFLCTQSAGCFMESLWEGFRRLTTRWYGEGKMFVKWASFLIPVFLYALVRHGFVTWKKERGRIFSLGAFSAVLMLELFILGIFRKYPFTGDRITLFLAPVVIFLLIKGMEDIRRIKWLFVLIMTNFLIFLASCLVSNMLHYIRLYQPFSQGPH